MLSNPHLLGFNSRRGKHPAGSATTRKRADAGVCSHARRTANGIECAWAGSVRRRKISILQCQKSRLFGKFELCGTRINYLQDIEKKNPNTFESRPSPCRRAAVLWWPCRA